MKRIPPGIFRLAADVSAAVLVTGAGGFLGRELCLQLSSVGRVVGVDLAGVDPVNGVEWIVVDESVGLSGVVARLRPRSVVHAAFRNRKPATWTAREYVAEAVSEALSLCEAVAEVGAALLLVSSSAVYGNARGVDIIDEQAPLEPVSLYGLAKTLTEEVAGFTARNGLRVCVVRLFNLIGPRDQPGMLLSDWVRQAVAVSRGEAEVIRVRHRQTARDFVDVRDAARALRMLTERFEPGGVFNVASETAVGLMEISGELERIAGRSLSFVETHPDACRGDVRSQRGSSRLLRERVGWQPAVPWRKSLAELWEWVASARS